MEEYLTTKEVSQLFKVHTLTIEQVKVCANPELDYAQMREIRKGFNNGRSRIIC